MNTRAVANVLQRHRNEKIKPISIISLYSPLRAQHNFQVCLSIFICLSNKSSRSASQTSVMRRVNLIVTHSASPWARAWDSKIGNNRWMPNLGYKVAEEIIRSCILALQPQQSPKCEPERYPVGKLDLDG